MSTAWLAATCLRRCTDKAPLRLQRGYKSTSHLPQPLDRTRAENSRRTSLFSQAQTSSHRQFGPYRARRWFTASSQRHHGHLTPPKPGEEIHLTILDQSHEPHHLTVAEGDNLLDIAQANDLEMEGACGGSCACSTCHIIVEDMDMYNKMPEPSDDENDMLDLAFGLTETSRLGCQIKMTKELDGLEARLPRLTRNLQKKDFEKGNDPGKKGG